MARDGNDMTCFRLPPHLHQAIREYCVQNNTTVSDLYRAITEAFLNGQISPGPSQGYQEARELATQLAGVMLRRALEELPETLGEAIARYGLVG